MRDLAQRDGARGTTKVLGAAMIAGGGSVAVASVAVAADTDLLAAEGAFTASEGTPGGRTSATTTDTAATTVLQSDVAESGESPLLAHELAHIVQQSGTAAGPPDEGTFRILPAPAPGAADPVALEVADAGFVTAAPGRPVITLPDDGELPDGSLLFNPERFPTAPGQTFSVPEGSQIESLDDNGNRTFERLDQPGTRIINGDDEDPANDIRLQITPLDGIPSSELDQPAAPVGVAGLDLAALDPEAGLDSRPELDLDAPPQSPVTLPFQPGTATIVLPSGTELPAGAFGQGGQIVVPPGTFIDGINSSGEGGGLLLDQPGSFQLPGPGGLTIQVQPFEAEPEGTEAPVDVPAVDEPGGELQGTPGSADANSTAAGVAGAGLDEFDGVAVGEAPDGLPSPSGIPDAAVTGSPTASEDFGFDGFQGAEGTSVGEAPEGSPDPSDIPGAAVTGSPTASEDFGSGEIAPDGLDDGLDADFGGDVVGGLDSDVGSGFDSELGGSDFGGDDFGGGDFGGGDDFGGESLAGSGDFGGGSDFGGSDFGGGDFGGGDFGGGDFGGGDDFGGGGDFGGDAFGGGDFGGDFGGF